MENDDGDTAFDPNALRRRWGRGNELVEPPPEPPPEAAGTTASGRPASGFSPADALAVGAVTPGVTQQRQAPAFDEDQEEQIRIQQEEAARGQQLLHHETGKPLRPPGLLQMDDFQKSQIKEMRDLALTIPDRKRADLWTKRANDLEGKIKSDLAKQNAQLHRDYIAKETADRRRADYPQKTPQQRETDAAVLDAAFDTVYAGSVKPDLDRTTCMQDQR